MTIFLVAVNPLTHFLAEGTYNGAKPNALFDASYYLAGNPDVAAGGSNPLAHFLEKGSF